MVPVAVGTGCATGRPGRYGARMRPTRDCSGGAPRPGRAPVEEPPLSAPPPPPPPPASPPPGGEPLPDRAGGCPPPPPPEPCPRGPGSLTSVHRPFRSAHLLRRLRHSSL